MSDRVALVTGGGSGIGRAVALALAGAGYAVTIAGRRPAALDETVQIGNSAGGEFLAIPTDISQPDQVEALFERTRERFGRLDVLFNNAGQGAPAVPIDELTIDQWFSVLGANVTGAFLCAREAVRLMKAQTPRGGRIINNGSISAHAPRLYSVPYTTTKHAITGLTKAIALEGRAFDIACGQIDIGNAATEMTERMTDGVLQADGSLKPEPRMSLDHVAQAVVYMASLPLDTNVQLMTIMATKMPFIGRG
jgi:NAD(P)-dependent dehydrogenase (short-subunit alcohol dehydrogenase family)